MEIQFLGVIAGPEVDGHTSFLVADRAFEHRESITDNDAAGGLPSQEGPKVSQRRSQRQPAGGDVVFQSELTEVGHRVDPRAELGHHLPVLHDHHADQGDVFADTEGDPVE